MLYLTFKKTEDVLIAVDKYFNLAYEQEWFDDPVVKEMVRDVDKSVVLGDAVIKSPVFGIMAPTQLSGGVKALILMLKEDHTIWGSACGDNCAKWIIEISKKKDITICLSHIMKFSEDFNAVCLDNDMSIHTLDDYRRCIVECLS